MARRSTAKANRGSTRKSAAKTGAIDGATVQLLPAADGNDVALSPGTTEAVQLRIGTDAAGAAAEFVVPLRISIALGAVEWVTLGAQSTAAVEGGVAEAVAKKPIPPVADTRFDPVSLEELGFAWNTALTLGLASRLAYANEMTVTTMARSAFQLDTCRFISVDDTQCFVASSADTVLVAFRGTESPGDWLSDLNALSTTRPYGQVHRGFLAAFQIVDALLRDELKKLPDRALVLTGHSLGGALATVAAAEWQGKFPIRSIYTFGQPAVGKGAFRAFMQANYGSTFFRFVNDNDVVPRVPPGFDHVGNLVWLNSSGGLRSRAVSLGKRGIAPADASQGPPMLSHAEFDALRSRLLAVPAKTRLLVAAPTDAGALEGSTRFSLFPLPLPSVSDHNLDGYLSKISRQMGSL